MNLNALDIQAKIRKVIEDINTQDIDEYREDYKNALVDLLRWIVEEKDKPKGLTSYVKPPGGTFEEQLQKIQDNVLNNIKKDDNK